MKTLFIRNSLATVLLSVLIGGSIGMAQAATITRTSAFEYDAATGLLTKEIIEPDNPQLRLETAYTYDAYGNKVAATTSSPATGSAAVVPRSSATTYDAIGQFPVSSSNALGQTETKTYDSKFGGMTSLTGPNGLTTQWQYDGFGRKIKEIRADGTQTKWDYLYCNGINGGTTPCPSLATYVIQVTPLAADDVTASGPWSKSYYDSLQREIKSETVGFDGTSVIAKDTQYDSLGRVYRTSLPYYANQTPQWSTASYDSLSRVLITTAPDGSQVLMGYNGLTTTVTNALNQTQTKIKNSQGQLVKVVDAQNNALTYQYDAIGNVVATIDPKGNVVSLTYDLRGRKTQMVDPDMGTWTYEYNALGELTKQTDAKGQVTSMVYDKLGRMTSRAEADLVSTWSYDNCAKGIGKLCSSTADNGYLKTNTYDSLGRGSSTTTTIDTAYTNSATYDANGRVNTVTYPTGLTVQYVYTPLGYLKEVRNSQTNALLWRADTQNALGQLLQQTYGNNVVTQQVFEATTGRLKNIYAGAGNGVQNFSYAYDYLGNLVSRTDGNQNLTETFLYDSLNRLTNAVVNSPAAGLSSTNYTFDSLGNITNRSDMGTYAYGNANDRPHALKALNFIHGGKLQYSYDANGSLIAEVAIDSTGQVIANRGRSEVYTSFGMPQAIGAPGISLAFAYGPEHQRVKQIAPTATTIYLHPDNTGGLFYEKDIKTDGTIEHKQFITAGGQVIALIKQTGTTQMIRYMHRDQLGSTTTITDEQGNAIERFAYEPFGKRRFPQGNTDDAGEIVGQNTDRGFTNHEHLEELGLIHMNGRIYDPAIGRFMSADPYIQASDNLQSYNRYAYVFNRPLTLGDPSGYFSLGGLVRDVFRGARDVVKDVLNNKVIKTVVVAVAAYYTAGYASAAYENYAASTLLAGGTPISVAGSISFTSGAIAGASGGFVAGYLGSNGSLPAGFKAALNGSLSGGASGFYGSSYSIDRVFANSVVGGIQSTIQGGKFGSGAFYSLATSALAYVNVQIRNEMIDQSKEHLFNDGTGLSRGLFGDGFKLAGGRWNPFEKIGEIQCSLLGCMQSGPGSVFGVSYSSGSITDLITEAFAGPHDKANSLWFYDAEGLIKNLEGTNTFALDLVTNYTSSLLFAAPLAAGALSEELGISGYRRFVKK